MVFMQSCPLKFSTSCLKPPHFRTFFQRLEITVAYFSNDWKKAASSQPKGVQILERSDFVCFLLKRRTHNKSGTGFANPKAIRLWTQNALAGTRPSRILPRTIQAHCFGEAEDDVHVLAGVAGLALHQIINVRNHAEPVRIHVVISRRKVERRVRLFARTAAP